MVYVASISILAMTQIIASLQSEATIAPTSPLKPRKMENEQSPSECEHLTDWWGCLLTDDGIWMQTCDYYPHCEACRHYEPKEKKDDSRTDYPTNN